MQGTVIVLNGPSSSGKTTLSHAVRDLLGVRAVAVPIDRLFSMRHPAHPVSWEMFSALSEATFAAAAGFARNGFHVIVDTVFERRQCFETAEQVLAAFDRRYVAVTCRIEELELREHARNDRPIGLARRQQHSVLHDVPYDLTVDTAESTVGDCASQIARLLGLP
jgi:chloramphenicol 3-O phosphotransferase